MVSRWRRRPAGETPSPLAVVEPDVPPFVESMVPPEAEHPTPTVDRRIDIAVALGAVVIGVILIIAAQDIRPGSVRDPIGSGGLADVMGGVLILGGLGLVVRRLLGWRAGTRVPSEGSADEPGLPSSALRSFSFFAAGWAWTFLLPRVGLVVSSFLLATFGLLAMGVRSWRKLSIIPVIFVLVLWVLFNRVFGVQYPAGPVDLFLADLIPRLDF